MRIVLAHLVAADSKFCLNAASFALLKEHAMFCSTYLTPHLLICLCRHYTSWGGGGWYGATVVRFSAAIWYVGTRTCMTFGT